MKSIEHNKKKYYKRLHVLKIFSKTKCFFNNKLHLYKT
jgi:hypothetical protein